MEMDAAADTTAIVNSGNATLDEMIKKWLLWDKVKYLIDSKNILSHLGYVVYMQKLNHVATSYEGC